MPSWTVVIRLTSETAWILVSDREGNDCLQARLARPRHRRALCTLLEGLALWSGAPLSVAISVAELDRWSFEEDVFGIDLEGPETDLVELSFLLPPRDRDRLSLAGFDALRSWVPGA